MTLFHISVMEGEQAISTRAFKTQVPLPEPGDVLVVKMEFWTPADITYKVGDTLELIERTEEAPFKVKCSLGNWVVKDKHHTSIWSNIEWAMLDGVLEKQDV